MTRLLGRRAPLTTRSALLCLGIGLVGLLAPTGASAQPVDDPGMAEPAPKPAPPPPKPAAPGRAQTGTGYQAAAAPEMKETVDVKVSYIDERGQAGNAVEGDVAFSERLAAPTLQGPIGLFRLQTAEASRPHNFRVALHIGGFSQDNFLIAGSGTTKGDTNGKVFGDLVIGYTPWKYIELYLGIYNASNRNVRTDPGRTDPEVILSMGDVGFGLKGRYTVARFIDIGLQLGLRFLNSVSGISFDGKSTNFDVNAILGFDLRRAPKTEKVPLRFTLNFGFLLDNSINLLPDGQCARSVGNDPCIRSRVVETFAYGIGTSRLKVGLGIDAPVVVRGVGIDPFVEYWAHIGVGDGDNVVKGALLNDPSITNKDRVTNRAQQWMTVGLRLRPVAGLVLDAGVDIGLQSPGFAYGPPVAPWQVIGGVGYVYDPLVRPSKTKVIEKTITREVARGPVTGRIRGIVRDASTKKPLGGVTIKYLGSRETPQQTGEDGTFVSYGFVPGAVKFEASRDDYNAITVDTQVVANGETPAEVLLVAKPPASGQLRIKVQDANGAAVAGAAVHLVSSSGAVIDADAEGPGAYVAKLPAGDYNVEVVADGYLAKQRQTSIAAGQVQSLEIALTKKPAVSRVSVGKGELVVKGVVHFGTNNAEIKLDGQQLLDEVADVIIRNPQLKKIRIEGHTDNRGVPQKNLELSKARANAVRDYLIKQGVDANRLEAEGYGATQPLVPNLTPANRAKNRRVAFKILEGGL